MSHDSAQEDVQPMHAANIRAIPYPDARVKLANLPKEQSHLNDLCAIVLSITSAKSSSGAIKVPLLIPPSSLSYHRLPPPPAHFCDPLNVLQLLVKLDLDGKRVSIPESMCCKLLNKLLVVDNKPIDIYIAPRDPMHKGSPLNNPPTPSNCVASPSHPSIDLTEAVQELGGHCVHTMTPTSIMIASPQAVATANPSGKSSNRTRKLVYN
jgi:hypothetical protein